MLVEARADGLYQVRFVVSWIFSRIFPPFPAGIGAILSSTDVQLVLLELLLLLLLLLLLTPTTIPPRPFATGRSPGY